MLRKRSKIEKLSLSILAVFLLACGSEPEESSHTEGALKPQPMPSASFEPVDSISSLLDAFLNDGMMLPETDNSAHPIRWEVVSGHARIENGTIFKTEGSAEYEPVVLLASAEETGASETIERLLLDPYVGYVISYFSENGEDKESLKLAYTYNGTYWFKLNNDEAVLKPETGTRRLRDPSFLRKKDGTFALLATQGYNTDSIYVFDTEDFITYSGERLLKVNDASEMPMSEEQAWAPEGFYDPELDTYVLVWSSVEDEGMFYNCSEDLHTFSPPRKLLDCGYPVIDGTFVKEGNRYAVVLKDERSPMETYSQLFLGFSAHGWNQVTEFTEPISGHQSEGPMIMKSLEQEGYFLFYDDYTRFQFNAFFTKDIFHPEFEEIEHADMMIPLEEPAHSYAIPVTWNELERLLNTYS